MVKQLLSEDYGKSGRYVNLPNNKGLTSLHLAAASGLVNVVDFLIRHGAMLNAKTKEDYTSLHYAVGCVEKDDTVTKLIGKLCNGDGDKIIINCRGEGGQTALHLAAGNGLIATTKLLLRKGADITIKDNEGETALHYAVRKSTQYNHSKDEKDTALQIIDELCARGDEEYANIKCKNGNTALNLAAENGSFRTIKSLLGKEVRLDIQDEEDNTPLHDLISCETKDEASLAEIVEMLCRKATDTFVNRTNHLGETALQLAARKRYDQVVERLLQQNVYLDNVDRDGWTALQSAVQGQSANAVCRIACKMMALQQEAAELPR